MQETWGQQPPFPPEIAYLFPHQELHMKILIAPAGGSAEGQPCDQIHRTVQDAEDTFIRSAAGEHPNLRLRCEGMRTSSISMLEEAEVDVRAMRKVTRVEVCRSWVVTGFLSVQQMSRIAGLPAA
eukprot:820952-Karenia_brevis.AAC.1